jgi:hypothetical protein
METTTITMDKEQAAIKALCCEEESHADSIEFNRACLEAYNELAEGHKLLQLSKSIQKAGLNEKGMPKLAIARADRKQVFFEWPERNPFAYYASSKDAGQWNRNPRRYPSLSRYVNMGQKYEGKTRKGFSLVPDIPADVRPQTGQKKDWYILWEVDEWSDTSFLPAPRDPILLRHIRGELYSVLAEWELTEVERAILEGLA